MVEATAVELSAAVWYLKQRALVLSDDKSNMLITVDGMDFLVSQRPVPEDVMAFMKPTAIAVTQARPKREEEAALATLNRALVGTSP